MMAQQVITAFVSTVIIVLEILWPANHVTTHVKFAMVPAQVSVCIAIPMLIDRSQTRKSVHALMGTSKMESMNFALRAMSIV
jgi:hypothetical protein